jgi:hypothetical protein
MKIKTRLDDSGMLESDEWFRMNHWLAELRDDGQAEPRDAGHDAPWADGRAECRGGSQAGPRDDGQAEPPDESRAEAQPEGPAETWDGGPAETQDDGPADTEAGGPAETQDDGRARSPRHSHLPPGAPAAADRLVPCAGDSVRAVIGDQLRIPIMWCEMDSCISWYPYPAALGEADVRARAISAGWRVDAVGLLVCPQCQQTAPGFQSPRPVALWDRANAITEGAPMASVPADDAVASAARELSHDLRRPDPSPEAAASALQELSHDLRRPADVDDAVGNAPREVGRNPRRTGDGHPASPLPPGRHRKRFAARIMPAALQAR